MSSSTFREPLTPLALNVLSNHAPLKIKVPKRKLSSCSINNTEAEVPFSVYSCEFPLMPNSRNSTLYSPTSNTKYKDLEEPPFPPTGTEDRNDPRSPPISPPSTELEESDKLRKTEHLPARKPLQATSPTSPKSPQYRYQLHTGPTPRTVSDVTGLARSRSRVNRNPITPPTSEVTVTRKRSRERNAVLGEKAQREDGYSRKFQQARILSDLTHNRGRNASSPRSQYAVFRAEAERVRGLTDLNARSNARSNSTHNMSSVTTPATTISTIDIDNSTSFTISTMDNYRTPVAQSYTITTRPAAPLYSDRTGRQLPRNVSQPPSRVIIRGGPRPAFSQRATSEMVRRRPSARGRTRSEVVAPSAGNVALNELREQVERGLRQRRVWMLRGKVFKRWQKVFARIEDCSALVLMRNGVMKRYRLRRAVATPAPDARTLKIKGGPRLTAFKVHLDGGKVLTFATEYATEADSWIHSILSVGDPVRNPIWDQIL